MSMELWGFISLGAAAILLTWTGLPPGGRGWSPQFLQDIAVDVQLSKRPGAIAVSFMVTAGCTYLAFSPVSFLTSGSAYLGMGIFGVTTIGLAILLAKWHDDVNWGDEIKLNEWAWVVVTGTVLGLILLAI